MADKGQVRETQNFTSRFPTVLLSNLMVFFQQVKASLNTTIFVGGQKDKYYKNISTNDDVGNEKLMYFVLQVHLKVVSSSCRRGRAKTPQGNFFSVQKKHLMMKMKSWNDGRNLGRRRKCARENASLRLFPCFADIEKGL